MHFSFICEHLMLLLIKRFKRCFCSVFFFFFFWLLPNISKALLCTTHTVGVLMYNIPTKRRESLIIVGEYAPWTAFYRCVLFLVQVVQSSNKNENIKVFFFSLRFCVLHLHVTCITIFPNDWHWQTEIYQSCTVCVCCYIDYFYYAMKHRNIFILVQIIH